MTIHFPFNGQEYFSKVEVEKSNLYGYLYKVGMPDTEGTLNFRRQDNGVFAPINSDDLPLIAAVGKALEIYYYKK